MSADARNDATVAAPAPSGSPDVSVLTATVRPYEYGHDYGTLPTEAEVLCIAAEFGSVDGHVVEQSVTYNAAQHIKSVRSIHGPAPIAELTGRILLNWEQAKRTASFTARFDVPGPVMRYCEDLYGAEQAHRILAAALWQRHHEPHARTLLLRDLVAKFWPKVTHGN